jgi:hypothetical protein
MRLLIRKSLLDLRVLFSVLAVIPRQGLLRISVGKRV